MRGKVVDTKRLTAGGLLACLTAIMLNVTGCTQAAPAVPNPDYWPTRDWQTSTPEAQGMDSETLVQMYETIEEQALDLHSLIVIRNGYIVSEAYFQPYGRYTPHDLASITKSVTGTLVSIAVQQGEIKSIDEPLLSFFPERHVENLDVRKEALTLENILTLDTGLTCDLAATEAGMQQSAGWVGYVLDLPMAAEPGETWYYCSPATHLASAVIQQTTGMTAREYANANLFDPLGIPAVTAEQWPSDPQGVTRGDIDLNMTPRSIAKLGLLYLQDGVWDGARLLPEGWVAAATSQQADKGDGTSYGYLWTTYPRQSHFAALGRGGEQLHIFPEQNMVVVVTAALPAYAESEDINALLNDYILPAAQSDEPLPDNAEAAALDAVQQRLEDPTPVLSPLTDTGRAVSGQTYLFDENPLGWSTLRIDFTDGAGTASVVMNGSETYTIGLDGRYRVTAAPGTDPIALRGRWVDDATLMIDEIIIGTPQHYELTLAYDGDNLNAHAAEAVFNSLDVDFSASVQE